MRFSGCTVVGALATGLAIVSPASAQQPETQVNLGTMTLGYTYFNRPGADIAAHDAAVAACAAVAAKVHSYDEQNPVQKNLVPVTAAGLVSEGLAGAAHHGVVGASLENCMVVRGWRVVSLSDTAGKELAALPQSALSRRLAPWVGSQTPHGEVVRTWANDAARPTTIRFAYRPAHTNNGQLSLISATGRDLTQFDSSDASEVGQTLADYAKSLDPRWRGTPLKANALGSVPPEGGVIIASVKRLSMKQGTVITFSREGSKPDVLPSTDDHLLDVAYFTGNFVWQGKAGFMAAVAVPAGHWRFSSVGSVAGALNFCLGAPSFEVKPGDVIYAGTFDLSGGIAPDLDLAPAQAWLDHQPQAAIVKPAVYTNGSTGSCGGNVISALEVDGAPFAAGYAWGSAATPAPGSASTVPH